MIEGSPALLASLIAYSDNFALTSGGVLNIYYDLIAEDVDLILSAARLKQIKFAGSRINENTLRHINDSLLISYEDATLRVHLNGHGAFRELDFLRNIPKLKHLQVDIIDEGELEKINDHLALNTLGIGAYKISLKPIMKHFSLKRLFISDRPKDLEIIGHMPWLESLTFSMQTLKDLDFIIPLNELKELHFMLGGTKQLQALPRIGKIEKLSFMRVRELRMEHLLPINGMKYLRELSFQDQPHLTDVKWLKDKSIKVEVHNCKNFR
jgi:hypothetical protein